VTNLSLSTVSACNGSALSRSFPWALHSGLAIVLSVGRRGTRVTVRIAIMVALWEPSVVVFRGILVVVRRVRRGATVIVVGASWRLGRRIGRPHICLRLQRREV
jgi:hypothetical protein